MIPSTKTENGLKECRCIACNEQMGSEVIYGGSSGLLYTILPGTNTCEISGIGSCTDRDVVIPQVIDGYQVIGIGNSAFYDCSELKSILIPKGITRLGYNAFFFCRNLTNVIIPDGVTYIGNGAFSSCNKLITITLPETLTDIGDSVFAHSFELTSIYYGGTVAQWETLTEGTTWNASFFGSTIYCSDGNITLE